MTIEHSALLLLVLLLWLVSPIEAAEVSTYTGLPVPASVSSRKGSAVLMLRDADGKPLVNATVEYIQSTHDFLFGVGMTSPRGRIPPSIYERLKSVGVNYALPFMTWAITEPTNGSYDWNTADYLYRPREMQQLGYTLNGHCMVWFEPHSPWNLPSYVRSMSFKELKQAISRHIFTLVDHYRGVMSYWTVNEPTFSYSDFFALTRTQWVEIISTAIEAVHKADPAAKVMVNVIPADHQEIGYSPHSILDALASQGVGFDVIGLELYSMPGFKYVPDANGYPSVTWASSMLDSYARYGRPVILSEVGVTETPSPDAQAEWLRAFYSMAFDKTYVHGVTWYFVDDDPFLPGAGLFPTTDSSPRPIYDAMADVIRERTTRGVTHTNTSGVARIDGYAGDYLIKVSDGTVMTSSTVHITDGEVTTLSISTTVRTSHTTTLAGTTQTASPVEPPTTLPQMHTTIIVGVTAIAVGIFVALWRKLRK
jgi:GH35 family endo-1,4-beta-xylanase